MMLFGHDDIVCTGHSRLYQAQAQLHFPTQTQPIYARRFPLFTFYSRGDGSKDEKLCYQALYIRATFELVVLQEISSISFLLNHIHSILMTDTLITTHVTLKA